MDRLTSFKEYANFIYTQNDKPSINLKTHKIIGHGAYTSTLEYDEQKVIKINRMLMISIDGKTMFHGYSERPFLVTKNEKDCKEKIKSRLEAFAEFKLTDYRILLKYMPKHLPKLYLTDIIKSPRKALELNNLKRPFFSNVDISKIEDLPEIEVTLSEIWEAVSNKTLLEKVSAIRLHELRKWQIQKK